MKQANDSFDLPRLTETDPGLAEELTLLKAQLPDASELALMASRLQLQGIDVTSPAAAPGATPSPWSKWLLVGGGAVAVGVGLWAVQQAKPVAPTDRGAAHSPPKVPDPSAPVSSNAVLGGRSPRGEVAIALPAAPVERAAPLVEEPAAPGAVTPPSDAPAVSSARPEAVRTLLPSRAAAPGAASLSQHSGEREGSSSSVASPQSATVPTEIELLREARLALKRSPATALELTEQHTRAYPSGRLVQERELIAVSALVALGRRTAALGRAAHFEQVFPQSPYRKQLAELLR